MLLTALIKKPGYLSALQQVIGRFFPSKGLEVHMRRVSSLQHWWETEERLCRSERSTQHCPAQLGNMKAKVVLILLGWTVVQPLIIG